MHFYEVLLKLFNHGKEIGQTHIQVKAENDFKAAHEAREIINSMYFGNISGQIVRILPISQAEFNFQLPA